jgi:hypothetical protein
MDLDAGTGAGTVKLLRNLAAFLVMLWEELHPRSTAVEQPVDTPAVCPECEHGRGRHRVVEGGERGPCLAPGCDCLEYGGPWPVHHLNVTTQPCDTCGQPGGHWAVQVSGGLLLVSSFRDLPGERE